MGHPETHNKTTYKSSVGKKGGQEKKKKKIKEK